MALLFEFSQKLVHGFNAFWTRWPRKVAKLEAEKAWKQIVKPEDEEPIQKALDWQLPIFEARDPEHRPHAATWIRGRRWEDEKPTPTISRPTAKVVSLGVQQQMDAASRIRSLVALGVDPEDAKEHVYREVGWIK